MNKSQSFSDSPASDLELNSTLERNISHVIDILDNEDTETEGEGDAGKDQPILKGVVTYVEVRTNNDNRSEAVSGMLKSHGAIVEKTFTDNVTHVIFKDGNKRTVDKAKKKGIHLVSVLWVDSCLRNGRCVSEEMYPAILPKKEKSTPIFFKKNRLKKMKSMQPNDFEHDVAKSSERYDRKKKKEEERLGLSGCSTPVASPIILAYDTVPRSPPSPSDWRSPIPLMIPNTPPSIKDTVNRLRQARLNNSAGSDVSVIDSPMIGDIPSLPPLHRKLFDGNEEMQTPSFNHSKNDHDTSHTDVAHAVNKSPPFHFPDVDNPQVDSIGLRILKSFDDAKKNENVEPATILKRKLFNVLDKNSPKPYLLEPSSCSETVRPSLLDSPVFGNKAALTSKVKGQKRKADTDSENSGKEKNLKKKSKDIVREKPVKNIYSEHVLENAPSEESTVNGLDVSSKGANYESSSKGANSESTSQRQSSRRSSILSKSNTSNSSLNLSETGRSSRRVSIATPDLPPPQDNTLRRSSRRSSVISLKSISELQSPNFEPETNTSKTFKNSRKSIASSEQTPTISEEGGTEINGTASESGRVKRGRKSMATKSRFSSPNGTAGCDEMPSFDQPMKQGSQGRKSLVAKEATPSPSVNGTDTPNSESSSKNVRKGRKSLAVKEATPSPIVNSISNGTDRHTPCENKIDQSTKTVRKGRKSLAVKEVTPSPTLNSFKNRTVSPCDQKSVNSTKSTKQGRRNASVDVQEQNKQTGTSSTLTSNAKIDQNSLQTVDETNSVNRRKSMRISAGSKSLENTPELDSSAKNNNSKLVNGFSKTSSKSVKASKSNDKTDRKSDKQDSLRLAQQDSSRLAQQDSSRLAQQDSSRFEITHPDTSCAEMLDHPDLSRANMSDYPDTSRNETTGFLGASMSAVFGDITMPSFSQAPSRRSIEDFKLVNRKKSSSRAKILTSISESNQNSPPKISKSETSKYSKVPKKRMSRNSENRGNDMSYELDDSEKPARSKVMLRRANSFLKEKNVTDAKGKITRPSLVMTSMHTQEQETVLSVIKKLGGFLLVDHVSDTTTHVVCGDSRRTLNLVNGVARGCWILRQDWVLKSLDEGSWLEEEDYEFSDVYPQVKINRQERQTAGRHYSQSIFTGVGSFFISTKNSPPRAALSSLIRLCGGEITGSASNCDIFIGTEAKINKTSLKPVWVLDCIMEHKLIDYNQPKYILNINHTKRESSPEF